MIRRLTRFWTSLRARGKDLDLLCRRLEARMDMLVRLVEREAALVRAGATRAADRLGRRQVRCARSFVAAFEAVNRLRRALGPHPALDRLQRRHREFRALLQLNLAALDAAREAADNLTGKGAPTAAKRKRRPIRWPAPSAGRLSASTSS